MRAGTKVKVRTLDLPEIDTAGGEYPAVGSVGLIDACPAVFEGEVMVEFKNAIVFNSGRAVILESSLFYTLPTSCLEAINPTDEPG